MARYKVLTQSFIANKLLQPGEIVEYDGSPGDNLQLVGDDVGAAGVEAPGGTYTDAADLA